MIDLLFDRRSLVVYGVIAAALYFVYANLIALAPLAPWEVAIIIWNTSLYAFTLLCRAYPWHSRAHRGHGIDEHFVKTFITAAYVYALAGLAFHLSHWIIFMILGAFLLIIPVATNIFVLIYYFQDPSTSPPGYHSRSLYLDATQKIGRQF